MIDDIKMSIIPNRILSQKMTTMQTLATSPPPPEPINQEVEETDHCPISTCPGASYVEGDDWILCDQCTKWYHLKCVALSDVPEEDWLCPSCVTFLTPTQSSTLLSPGHHNLTLSSGGNKKAAAKRWIQESLVAVDPTAHTEIYIKKTDIFSRYSTFLCQSTDPGVTKATLGKYIQMAFPNTKSRRLGSRGNSHNVYEGIKWADTPPPDPHQQGQKDLGEILSGLKMSTPTLRRVPRGARMAVAHCLTKILKDVVESGDEQSWRKLLLFTYAALPIPQRADRVKNLTTWVKTRTAAWDANFFIPEPHPPRPSSTKSSHDETSKKVEAKLADGDIRGAIRLACSDDTFAPKDDTTLSALLEKHPPHPQPTNFPPPPADPSVAPVLDPEVFKAISTFPPGSAGGLDGMRPQILKDLLGCNQGESGVNLADAICAFLNLTLNGGIPENICPLFYGASLTALKKKSGGIRPIAVGNTWRRLAAKVVVARITPQLIDHFSPHQLGVGVKGGAEIGAHTARVYYNHPHSL